MVAGACAMLGIGGLAIYSRADDQCVSWVEAPGALDPSRDDDRRHLVSDLAAVDRRAEEFSATVAGRPLLSDSIDARASALTAPARALAWCAAVLTDRVAATHAVSASDLQRLAPATRHTSSATGETHAAKRR